MVLLHVLTESFTLIRLIGLKQDVLMLTFSTALMIQHSKGEIAKYLYTNGCLTIN